MLPFCSALYVVDLQRFRRIAAGDRLRGQYQALSQDPDSLSNLDQVSEPVTDRSPVYRWTLRLTSAGELHIFIVSTSSLYGVLSRISRLRYNFSTASSTF